MYAGTEIVQCRRTGQYGAFALVTRTNFLTTKGTLVRSILYSAPKRFDLYGDTYKVLLCTTILALIVLATILPVFIKYYKPYDIVIRILSPFTVAIPALLPICMSVGILFAFGRLYMNGIYCTSPQKINAAGRVSQMVFDKTGTLTHSGLNLVAMKFTDPTGFANTSYNPAETIENNEIWRNPNQYESESYTNKFVECMAC